MQIFLLYIYIIYIDRCDCFWLQLELRFCCKMLYDEKREREKEKNVGKENLIHLGIGLECVKVKTEWWWKSDLGFTFFLFLFFCWSWCSIRVSIMSLWVATSYKILIHSHFWCVLGSSNVMSRALSHTQLQYKSKFNVSIRFDFFVLVLRFLKILSSIIYPSFSGSFSIPATFFLNYIEIGNKAK